jgi:hypothetical protein
MKTGINGYHTNTDYVEVKCPYCGQKSTIKHVRKKEVEICDPDEGGCDKYFVYTTQKQFKWRTFKIEEKGR